jgi:hypothetical protein
MLWVAEQVHHGGDAIQRGLEVMLRCTPKDGLLDLAHLAPDLEIAGGSALC